MSVRVVFGIGIFLVQAAIAYAEPVEVTSCNQTVSDGYLTHDLDCSGSDPYFSAVNVSGRLELRGFTITGGPVNTVVECLSRQAPARSGACVIVGPGTLRALDGPLRSTGVGADRVKLIDVTIEGGDNGVLAGRVIADNTTVRNSTGNGIQADWTVRLRDSNVIDSAGAGVMAQRWVKLERSSVTGSTLEGVVARRLIALRDSQVTGNALDPAVCQSRLAGLQCAPEPHPWLCADLAAHGRVAIEGNSACDTSLVQGGTCPAARDYRSGETFHVCSAD